MEPMHFYVVLVLVINHRVIVSIVLLYEGNSHNVHLILKWEMENMILL